MWLFLWNRNLEAQTTKHDPKLEQTEEYGIRDVTVGDRYMKIRHTERRYSATT